MMGLGDWPFLGFCARARCARSSSGGEVNRFPIMTFKSVETNVTVSESPLCLLSPA